MVKAVIGTKVCSFEEMLEEYNRICEENEKLKSLIEEKSKEIASNKNFEKVCSDFSNKCIELQHINNELTARISELESQNKESKDKMHKLEVDLAEKDAWLRFIGVNLGKYEAVGLIMDYKGYDKCDFEQALSRVEHPQPFIDIAKQIVDELYNVCDIEHWLNREIERAKISMDEYAECFDGVKVDDKTRKELLKGHIRFCENGLKILKE